MKLLTVPQNCKCIGPDPAAGWLDERQRYCGGNCGISGITATCDHLQPGLSGKRLACGYHVVGHNRRASGRVVMMCAKLHLDLALFELFMASTGSRGIGR